MYPLKVLFRKAFFYHPKFVWILEITSEILESDIIVYN